MLVEDCFFDVSDDAMAVKAGKDEEGLAVAVSAHNITFRRCEVRICVNFLFCSENLIDFLLGSKFARHWHWQ